MNDILFIIEWMADRGINTTLLLILFALLNFMALLGSVWVLGLILDENTDISLDLTEPKTILFTSLITYCVINLALMLVLPHPYGRVVQLTAIQVIMQISYIGIITVAFVLTYIISGIVAGFERLQEFRNIGVSKSAEKFRGKNGSNTFVLITGNTQNYSTQCINEEHINIDEIKHQEFNDIHFTNDYEQYDW